MTKGTFVVPVKPTRKWVTLFDEWYRSPYIALLVHCADIRQCRAVQKSAVAYRVRRERTFWTHMDGADLYLIRSDAIKKYAVETLVENDGLIRFCVQESMDAERELYNRGMID